MPHLNAPLTSSTPLNQTAPIAILSGFSLGLLLLSILLRLYNRLNTPFRRTEDTAFYIAIVLGLCALVTTLYLVSRGLGRDVDALRTQSGGVDVLEKGVLATTVLYLGVLAASKASCGCMLGWITPYGAGKRVAMGLVGAAGVWVCIGGFVVGFGCPGLVGCGGGWRAQWLWISITDMLLELSLVGASIYMVYARSMSRRAKYTVVGAFSCRLPNVAITLTRLIFLHTTAPTSAIYIARIQAATQLATGYTIVSCVIPYLRPLMQSYEEAGTTRGSVDANFKMSQRSRGSKGSGSCDEIGKGDVSGEMGKMAGIQLNDVSRLLTTERSAFTRLRSVEEGEMLQCVPPPTLAKEMIGCR